MQSIRQVARNTFRLSRRFSADAAAPQTPPEKAKQFVLDNQKQIGGGVFTLILFKMIFGGSSEEVVDEKFEQIAVTVPDHAKVGDKINVANPHMPSTVYTVEVPQNKRPGTSFQVKIPKCPKEISVVLPEDKKPGDTIPVQHPGRPNEVFTVKIPNGKKNGATFKVALP